MFKKPSPLAYWIFLIWTLLIATTQMAPPSFGLSANPSIKNELAQWNCTFWGTLGEEREQSTILSHEVWKGTIIMNCENSQSDSGRRFIIHVALESNKSPGEAPAEPWLYLESEDIRINEISLLKDPFTLETHSSNNGYNYKAKNSQTIFSLAVTKKINEKNEPFNNRLNAAQLSLISFTELY